MLQPIRLRQSNFESPFLHEYTIQDCTTEWAKHEAVRLKKAAAARALSFNKCPVDFEYLVYKFLKFLKADEKLATGLVAESIYCHARSLIILSRDYLVLKEILDSQSKFTFEDEDDELLFPRITDDGFMEPRAKNLKSAIRERHYRLVNFVEKCLRRYILEDWSVSICDNDQASCLPPVYRLRIDNKKSIMRLLFYDIGLPCDVFEQFFVQLPDSHS